MVNPADTVQHWPLDRLIPYARNARTHPPEQIAQLAGSIKQWGFTMPVLVAPGGVIIAGHGRVMAARSLGLATVPVMVADGWTEAQQRAYVIADNKLAMNAEWDFSLLAGELSEIDDGEFDVALLGFTGAELEHIATWTPDGLKQGHTDPDVAPEAPVVPVSSAGDLWILGDHRLLCGDATSAEEVAALLAGAKPGLMVTDPPYGVEYDASWRAEAGVNRNKAKLGKVLNDDRADWREAWALFPGAVAYCWHADRRASEVQRSLEAAKFVIRCQVIWAKDRFALSRGAYHWQHEPCWYAVRDGATGNWHGDRSQSTLWAIPAREDGGHGHGTQKPVECMRRPMLNNSGAGEGVYDPFVGSGTTIIAAETRRTSTSASRAGRTSRSRRQPSMATAGPLQP